MRAAVILTLAATVAGLAWAILAGRRTEQPQRAVVVETHVVKAEQGPLFADWLIWLDATADDVSREAWELWVRSP